MEQIIYGEHLDSGCRQGGQFYELSQLLVEPDEFPGLIVWQSSDLRAPTKVKTEVPALRS